MTTDGGGWTLIARPYSSGGILINRDAVGTLTSPTQSSNAKLSDSAINSIRGAYSTSIFRINCGAGNAYLQEDKEFNAAADQGGAILRASSTPSGAYTSCSPWSTHYGLNTYVCPVPYTIYQYASSGCYPIPQGVVWAK